MQNAKFKMQNYGGFSLEKSEKLLFHFNYLDLRKMIINISLCYLFSQKNEKLLFVFTLIYKVFVKL